MMVVCCCWQTVPSLLGQLFCLASNPDKQDELFAEINRLIPDRGADVTDDVIQKSSYLKACIKEGFRSFIILLHSVLQL